MNNYGACGRLQRGLHFLTAIHSQYAGRLDDDENDVLTRYMETGYRYLNQALRTRTADEGDWKDIRTLDRVIGQAPKFPLALPASLYRGTRLEGATASLLRSGQAVVHRGYLSTSLSRCTAELFGTCVLRLILAPDVRYLIMTWSDEFEVLLQRGLLLIPVMSAGGNLDHVRVSHISLACSTIA